MTDSLSTCNIIGVSGRKGHGKDTIADYICLKYNFIKISFADPLKETCRILFFFDDNQLYHNKKEEIDPLWNITPRKTFEYIGTDIMRNNIEQLLPTIGNDFWVKHLKYRVEKLIESNKNIKIVVSDVRFQNEVALIKELGGICVKVKRNNSNNTTKYIDHESESYIDDLIDIDYDICANSGDIKGLYTQVDCLMKNI